MSANPALEPEPPVDDVFLDAALGVERVVHHLGGVIDDAVLAGDHPTAPDAPDGHDAPDDLLDALLGLVSLRKTVALILAAASSSFADPAPPADATWSRELLR